MNQASAKSQVKQQAGGWNSGAVALLVMSTAYSLTTSLFSGDECDKRGSQANMLSFSGWHINHLF